MKKRLIAKMRRRSGQGMTEYIILVALVAIILAAAVYAFRGDIAAFFQGSGEKLTEFSDTVEGTSHEDGYDE